MISENLRCTFVFFEKKVNRKADKPDFSKSLK